jgi:ribosome-associated toxin RatA of RatAB toxin-antitoxin module
VIEVRKTLLVPYSAERMFDLIERAEDYPRFLPWCASATILERSDDVVSAAITVDYHGVKFHFTTRNPKRRPAWLAIRLERGPFRRFEGEWHLAPLGDEGCRIQFDLHYEFTSTVMRTLAGPVFAKIADTLVDAFVGRAEQVYATVPPQAPAQPAAPPPFVAAAPVAAVIEAGIAARTVTAAEAAPPATADEIALAPTPAAAAAMPAATDAAPIPGTAPAAAPLAPSGTGATTGPHLITTPSGAATFATAEPAPPGATTDSGARLPAPPPRAAAGPANPTSNPIPEGAMPNG